jgi:prepilin-type N-terminal cleavage/methylation domain-containing protein
MLPKTRAEAGFTLIELLVVICIIAILISLTTVATTVVLNNSHRHATEAMLKDLAAACVTYQQRWGDYPPSSIDDIGGHAPNELNNGIESLVACLSSKKRGGPLFQKDDQLCNVDGDTADRNLTDWYFGTNELFEYQDYFGHVIIYFHHRDYEKTRSSVTRYKFFPESETLSVFPQLHPTTKTYVNAGRFQLRSVGRDGKPGTGDDIRADD